MVQWAAMITIGLSGGIGSGKSTVAGMLAELGAAHIDADKVGHEVYHRGTRGWRALVAEFGDGILDANKDIDRKKLGAGVFRDPSKLAKLNTIVHPLIMERVGEIMEDCGRKGVKVVAVEGAVLLEAGWKEYFDEVWAVVASEADVVQRVKEGRGAREEDVKARIKAQMSNEERKRHADVVIVNTGNIEELRAKVRREWENLLKRHRADC